MTVRTTGATRPTSSPCSSRPICWADFVHAWPTAAERQLPGAAAVDRAGSRQGGAAAHRPRAARRPRPLAQRDAAGNQRRRQIRRARRVPVQGRTDAAEGGANGNFYNAFAAFLLGAPNRSGAWDSPSLTRRAMAVQPLRARSVAADLEDHAARSARARNISRCRSRADRGLERYDVNTNMMMIGGVGSVPMDLGVSVSKAMFAPRLGFTYRIAEQGRARGVRHHERSVLAGAADAHESSRRPQPDRSTADSLAWVAARPTACRRCRPSISETASSRCRARHRVHLAESSSAATSARSTRASSASSDMAFRRKPPTWHAPDRSARGSVN